MRICDLRRADAVLIRCLQPAVADVFHHGAGKQMRVLQDDTEGPAQIILLDIAHVDAVIGDVAALNVIEAVDEVRDRRLARTGRADEGDLLAGLGIEREVFQHRLVRIIGEVDVVEADVALQRHMCAVRLDPVEVAALARQRDGALVDLGRGVQHVENALRTGQRQHDGVELICDLADPVGECADVLQERDEDTAGALASQPQCADGAGDGIEHVRQVVQDRADDGRGRRCHGRGAVQRLVDRLKIGHDLLFVREDLDIALSCDHFLNVAVYGRGVLLLCAVAVAADLCRDAHDKQHDGAQNDHDGKQPHGQHEHHGDGARERGDGDEHLRDAVLQQLVRRLDVVRVIAHEAAVRIGVKIADGQLLHTGKQLRAQLTHDDGARFEHKAVEQVVRHGAEEIQRAETGQQAQIFCVGLIRRDAAFLQKIGQRAHAVGRADRAGHIGQNGCHGADEQHAAVTEIAEQAEQRVQGRLRAAVIPKLNSGHAAHPPPASGCHRRRDKSGCAPSAPHACRRRRARPRAVR